MTTLPPEIWAMILSPMDRRDVLNTALVSRALSDPARRVWAQTVVLDGRKGPGYQEYIETLRQHDLLRLIKELEVIMVPLDVIPWGELPNLLSLSLGPICADQSQCPKDWTGQLYAYVTQLSTLKLEEMIVQSEFPMPEGKLAIPNIKRITWHDGGALLLPFFSLCKASLQTITEATIVVTDDPSETDAYTKLWKLRFPNLRLLNIGPGNAIFRVQDYPALDEAFTRFLHAHPTIENLTLSTAYDPDFVDDGDVYMPLHPSTVTRTADTILPNLTFLQAHPQQIQIFVDANVQFFRTLQTLALPEEPHADLEDSMTDLLDSFEQYNQRNGTPSGIRHLTSFLYAYDYVSCALDPSEFKSIMFRVSEVYPTLEVWEGTAPRVSVLKKCFPKFNHLKKLHCILQHGMTNITEVQTLAELCPSLEIYRCIKSGREFAITREGLEGRVHVRVSSEGGNNNGEDGVDDRESGDEDADADANEDDDDDYDEEFGDGEY
ncbi:hypothetical protein D9619_009452 [Psilocybe cf. subviscida]|uniref:F-box domain-containing protein n=1 Tax=Psilocybe cf. subviscida TaxID=2480587 RepID=A0A8H5BU14_9AGAR|nr:hypothetical protein D9619_009452 [Psilocybe cf. subviscida]